MWVLINLLTFGNVNKLFQIQQLKVQEKVLEHFNIDSFKPSDKQRDVINVINILNILSIYRNICAHNERLYCFEVHMNIDDYFMNYLNIFPDCNDVIIAQDSKMTLYKTKRKRLERQRKGIPTLLFGLSLFLSKTDFRKIKTDLDKEIQKLSTKLPEDVYNQIIIRMGLDFNWKNSL